MLSSYQDISKLHKRRDLARKTLNELSEELKRISSELEERTPQLTALRRGLAVTEREIKDSQGEIFLLHRKRTEIDQVSSVLLKDIQTRGAELAKLNNSKDGLNTDIKNIEIDIQEASNAASALEAKKQDGSSRVDEMEAEKRRLSDDMSQILSRTSLERDKIEAELNDLSTALFHSIAERDGLKQQLSAQETATNEMTKGVSELDEKVALLEEIKALQGERVSLKADIEKQEGEVRSLAPRLKEVQKISDEKQEQADRLSTENAERKYSVDSLEKEVVVYDEAVSALDSAQERWKSSSQLAEQGRNVLKKLFIDKARLEEKLRTAMEKVTGTVEVMKAIN
jgi:chromosome segregation ATPase